MQTEATAQNPAVRIAVVVACGLVVLLALGAVIRPDMVHMGMAMARRLIVGFGL
jgi:hypothetical protein